MLRIAMGIHMHSQRSAVQLNWQAQFTCMKVTNMFFGNSWKQKGKPPGTFLLHVRGACYSSELADLCAVLE